MGFVGSSVIKTMPANEGDADSIPGQEDPPERKMATHSSFLAWDSPWTEELGRLKLLESQRVAYNLATERAPT